MTETETVTPVIETVIEKPEEEVTYDTDDEKLEQIPEEMTPTEIEEAILNIPEPTIQPKVSKKFLPTKASLIEDILKINQKFSKRQLGRKRKSELETILAGSFEDTCEEVLEKPEINHETMLNAMYSCLLGVAGLAEKGTKTFVNYMPGRMVLHEYPQRLNEPQNKAVIMGCLEEIYDKNEIMIQSMLGVETRLLFVFGVSAISSLKRQSINEDRHEASFMHRSDGVRQNISSPLFAQDRRPVRRHVSPNHCNVKPSKPDAIPVLNQRELKQAKQSIRPP